MENEINAASFRSNCPIASTLDIIGDKWTFVLIRDLAIGASRYSDFLASPEGIPTNILAARLKMMERQGIILKEAYQTNPVRYIYRLTEKGNALRPVIRSLKEWGMEWIPGRDDQAPNLGWNQPA